MASPVAALTPRRAVVAGIAAAALGIAGLGAHAQTASAAFDLPECQGASNVAGQGASFQKELHAFFKSQFEGGLIGCGGAVTAPTFNANGSGDGIASAGAGGGDDRLACALSGACSLVNGRMPVGQRDMTVSFQASDDPPTDAQHRAAEEGDPNNPNDNEPLHIIPVATGSATLIMHVPAGCTLKTVDTSNLTNRGDRALDGLDTGDSASGGTGRLQISGSLLERVWAGEVRTWGQIAPGISGDPTSSQYPVDSTTHENAYHDDCGAVPIRRIVRSDNSGTTYSWKAYLNLINPNRQWTGSTYAANPNTQWPVDGTTPGSPTLMDLSTANSAPTALCPVDGTLLCANRSTGGGGLADAVNTVDGSIGYVDLATAREKGFTNDSTASTQDPTIWSPLETSPETGGSGEYAEPTLLPTSHVAGTTKGASCGDAQVVNAPDPAKSPQGDPTLGDWGRAYVAGGDGYPACVLTYELVWDDSSVVYGNTPDQQAKARTVKDYVSDIVSDAGQAAITAADYSPLPNTSAAPLRDWAQEGMNAVDWNKSAGGGGNNNQNTGPNNNQNSGGNNNQNNGGNTPPPAQAPSNAFSIPSHKVTATQLQYTLQLPGKGSLKAAATAKVGKKTIKVASVSASPKGAGRVTVKLNLSSAFKKALARAKGKKLKVTVKFTYTPTGGAAATKSSSVIVRAAKKKPARKAKKKTTHHKAAKRA
jgi:ABC-type phosphate transport system substrate-binding protein